MKANEFIKKIFTDSSGTTFKLVAEAVNFDSVPYENGEAVAFSFEALGLGGHSRGALGCVNEMDASCLGLSEPDRIRSVKNAWRLATVDPNARQIVRLYSDHVLGNGMTVTAKAENAQRVFTGFFVDTTNARRLSHSGKIKESDDLLKGGEWFIWLHGNAGKRGQTKLRRIKTLEITGIISNPDDKDEVWFYERTTIHGARKQERKRWYRDISLKTVKFDPETKTFPDLIVFTEGHDGELTEEPLKLPDNVRYDQDSVVHHVTINSTDQRGYSILVASMIWGNQFKNFMESRIVLQRARTVAAWDEKIRGSAADIAARKTQLESTLSISNPWDTNPPAAAGSTHLHNEGNIRTPVEQKTAAQDAKIDGDMLIQMVGLGSGIFAQYLGQEAYRLTTTRVIEGPMMKAFQSYQQTLSDAYAVIFNFVLENAGVPEKDREFDIDFAPINDKARSEAMEMLETFLEQFPEFRASKELQTYGLGLLNINNVDQVLAEVSEAGDQVPPATIEDAASGMSQAALAFANFMEKEHEADAAEIETILGGAEVATIGAN